MLADNSTIELLKILHPAMASLAQELRQTVERLTMTGCGGVLLVTGWLLSGQRAGPTFRDRLLVSVAMVIFVGIATAVTGTLRKRYRGVAMAIRNINSVERVHEVGAFLEGRPLYPPDWAAYGSPTWREPIFRVAYISWSVVAVFSITALWIL